MSLDECVLELLKDNLSIQAYKSKNTIYIQLFVAGECVSQTEVDLEDKE